MQETEDGAEAGSQGKSWSSRSRSRSKINSYSRSSTWSSLSVSLTTWGDKKPNPGTGITSLNSILLIGFYKLLFHIRSLHCKSDVSLCTGKYINEYIDLFSSLSFRHDLSLRVNFTVTFYTYCENNIFLEKWSHVLISAWIACSVNASATVEALQATGSGVSGGGGGPVATGPGGTHCTH